MNRLTKILSAIALASAVSTGMVVVAGCNGCNQPETPPSPPPEEHVHTYSPDWSFDGQKHWHAATCEHTDLKSDEAAHADANNDGVCDVCGYDEMPIAPYNVGIEMNKTVTEYVLDGTATAAISLDDISVNLVRSDGADAGALEDYTLKCYKGQTELTEEQMAAAGEGAYNIWAEAEIDSNGTTVKVDSFVVVYVVDEIVSLSFDAEAAGTVTTQQTSVTDEMSATWNFKATFKSGDVRTLTAEDVEIENLNTTSATDEGVANISYVYTNAKGEDKEVETTVNYTVTAPQGGGEQTSVTGVYNASEAVAGDIASDTVIIEETGIKATVLATSSSTVTIDGNKKEIDGFTFTQRMKLGGTGKVDSRSIKIEVQSAATIIVYAISSSGTADQEHRPLALKDSTFATIDDTQQVDENLVKLTYTIAEAGTYYLASTNSGINIYYISITTEGEASAPAESVTGIYNASEAVAGDIVSDTVIIEETGIKATVLATSSSTVTIDGNKKEIDGLKFTQRIKLNGTGKVDSRSIKIEVASAATVVVYGMSGSSGKIRTLALFGSTFTPIDETQTNDGNAIAKLEYTLNEAGTYYLASTNSGINIYYISITTVGQ